MIAPSSVPDEAKAYITDRLTDLARDRGVRILFAAESGSRAWGFPSADSDYDVRFVYVRSRQDYLSIRDVRDVVETPIIEDPTLGVPFDLNGWDLRKALRLALSSNPILTEWLTSPIRYTGDHSATESIRALAARAADPGAYRYHYDRLCRGAWNEVCGDPDHAMVKRYCYALRPALMLLWLDRHEGAPPMDVHTLCHDLSLPHDLVTAMSTLFAKKLGGGEKDMVPRIAVLDQLIAQRLETVAPRPEKPDLSTHPHLADADVLFANLL